MTVPMLGPLTTSGFEHKWWFLFVFVVIGLVGLYVLALISRRRRLLRFANMDILERVAPTGSRRWRHLPAILLVVALLASTVGLAGPTHSVQIPRNRAVVMLLIQVSPAMTATDMAPSRLVAAQQAGRQITEQLPAGINLGLIAFSGTPAVLVSPTIDHQATMTAIDKLQVSYRTAVGDAIFAALQSIATVGAVLGGGSGAPPARIVLESTGRENHPPDPDNPRGEFTAARAARDQGVPISTIAFGTPNGTIQLDGAHVSVPVEDDALKRVAQLSGGHAFHVDNTAELKTAYASIQQQIGYETVRGDNSTSWFRLGVLLLVCAALAGLLINRTLPN
ncbi:VWA domain-containing protein [Mycobacterium montefiorense]|nr:VWA domain-containing protein [Mycobacterium montefiorense]